jgi:uncharacterized protein
MDARNNHIDYVEFPASSPGSFAAAKAFYRDAFGWAFQEWGDEYADTKDSGVTTGLSAAEEHRPAAALAVLFASDLEAARERVVNAGGTIAREIISFPGGRRFEFVDPAGNRLGVWSDN